MIIIHSRKPPCLPKPSQGDSTKAVWEKRHGRAPFLQFSRLLRGISLRMTLGWERRIASKLLLKEGNDEVQVRVKLSMSGAHSLSPWAYSKATGIICFTVALRLSNPSKSVSSWRATRGKGMSEMCKNSQKRRDFSFKLQGQVRR